MMTDSRSSLLPRLLGGGVLLLVGALLALAFIPNLVAAQTESDETTPSTEVPGTMEFRHRGEPGGHQAVTVTAELVGVTNEEVITALQDGASLASYAAEQGVARADLSTAIASAVQQNLDERVADGVMTQEHADELAAQIDQRVEELVDRQGFPTRGGPGCNQDSEEEAATDSI